MRSHSASALSAEPTSEPTPEMEMAPAGRSLKLLRAALPAGLAGLAGRIGSARELARTLHEEEREPLPTALPAIDLLLAGGLPRGQLVELVGGRSSGRF